MPYADPERRREAKRQSSRRARSRRVDPVDPVDPQQARPSVQAVPSPAPAPSSVDPCVDPTGSDATRAAALLEVLVDELALVRAFDADPLARGRVVASLVTVALTASRAAELEREVAELERTVARLRQQSTHDRRPRSLA